MLLYVGDTNSNPVNALLPEVRAWCVEAGRGGKALFPGQDEEGVEILLDSGAFPDVKRGRVTFEEALARQLSMEARSGWNPARVTLVSYDLLIDEVLDPNGNQKKERWEEGEGWRAVEVTVDAAEFLSERRAELLPRRLCLSCQGVTPSQYEHCARRVLAVSEPGDVFGFGGWCILGQQRWRFAEFQETIRRVLPLIAAKGIKRAHVFGVAWGPACRFFADLCRSHGIQPSTDTTRFYLELTRGYVFDPASGKSHQTGRGNLAKNMTMVRSNILEACRWFSDGPRPMPTYGQTSLFDV